MQEESQNSKIDEFHLPCPDLTLRHFLDLEFDNNFYYESPHHDFHESNGDEILKIENTEKKQTPIEIREFSQKEKDRITDLVPSEIKNLFSAYGLPFENQFIYFDRPSSKSKEGSKNILRNFSNAQNQYILYDAKARKKIQERIFCPRSFDKWVRSLKLENFKHYQQAWSSKQHPTFTKLYRELCWQFYSESAVPYIFGSRIKNMQIKISHMRQISLFLKAILEPSSLKNFRKNF